MSDKGSGDVETLKQLLFEDGAEVNCANSANESLLVVAVRNKREECVKTLISHGAELNRKGGPIGNTPLHEAVLQVKLCNILRFLSLSFLYVVLQAVFLIKTCVFLFLDAVNFHLFQGNVAEPIVKELLSAGANTNKKNDKGQTAISLANEKGYEKIVEALAVNVGQELLDRMYDSKLDATDEMNY